MRRVHIPKPRPLEVRCQLSVRKKELRVEGGRPYLFAPVTRMVTVEDGFSSGSCGCTSIEVWELVYGLGMSAGLAGLRFGGGKGASRSRELLRGWVGFQYRRFILLLCKENSLGAWKARRAIYDWSNGYGLNIALMDMAPSALGSAVDLKCCNKFYTM
jgi:hypothetical protein